MDKQQPPQPTQLVNNVPLGSETHFAIIREALPTDLEKIIELNQYLNDLSRQHFDQTMIEGWSQSDAGRAYFTSRIGNPAGIFLVAMDGSNYIGYANGIERKSESYRVPAKSGVLENIMVIPEYQKKCIAKKLMEIFFDWCRTKQLQRISTSVFLRNTNAHEFYKHLGFSDYDVRLEINLVPKK